jgi:hypothetical protein
LSSSAPLVAIELMTVSIGVGGMVCIAIVARVARDALDEVARVAFFGMRRARAMTTLRRMMIANPADNSVANSLHRGRRLANAVRGLMGLVTLAIVILGAWIVTR